MLSINKGLRSAVEHTISLLWLGEADRDINSGRLNHVFTLVVKQYLGIKGESDQTYNDIIGALEGCKLELHKQKSDKIGGLNDNNNR